MFAERWSNRNGLALKINKTHCDFIFAFGVCVFMCVHISVFVQNEGTNRRESEMYTLLLRRLITTQCIITSLFWKTLVSIHGIHDIMSQ